MTAQPYKRRRKESGKAGVRRSERVGGFKLTFRVNRKASFGGVIEFSKAGDRGVYPRLSVFYGWTPPLRQKLEKKGRRGRSERFGLLRFSCGQVGWYE